MKVFKLLLLLAISNSIHLNAQRLEGMKIYPSEIKIMDNVERTILNYTVSDDIGMLEMIAPSGWTEPIVELDYETRGFVLQGVLGLEFRDKVVTYSKNEGFIIPENTRVRIFNANDSQLRIIEILRPAFNESLVKKHSSFYN